MSATGMRTPAQSTSRVASNNRLATLECQELEIIKNEPLPHRRTQPLLPLLPVHLRTANEKDPPLGRVFIFAMRVTAGRP